MIGYLVNNQLKVIWKEPVVAQYESLSINLSGNTQNMHNISVIMVNTLSKFNGAIFD